MSLFVPSSNLQRPTAAPQIDRVVCSVAMSSNVSTINEATVRQQGWYNEFSTGNNKLVNQALGWGADEVIIVGIKGDSVKSAMTNAEFPALLADLQRAMGDNYSKLDERRIDIAKLDKVRLNQNTNC